MIPQIIYLLLLVIATKNGEQMQGKYNFAIFFMM